MSECSRHPGGLTEGLGEPLRLVIVDYSHTQSIQAHHTQNNPVEALSFHHAPDEESDPFLLPPEVGRTVHFTTAFHTSSPEWRARRSCRQWRKRLHYGFFIHCVSLLQSSASHCSCDWKQHHSLPIKIKIIKSIFMSGEAGGCRIIL